MEELKMFCFQAPINFLPTYKNPCWYNLSVTDDNPVLKCVPYFFVPGMPKCGSTMLFEVLKIHHQILPAVTKEMPDFMAGTHCYRYSYLSSLSLSSDVVLKLSSPSLELQDMKQLLHLPGHM